MPAPERTIGGTAGEAFLKTERTKEIMGAFPGKRIAVFGDLMLGRYIWGQATRISQEAPVPIIAVNRRSAAPGGAANVLRNIASLGGQAAAYGVIGEDANAGDLMTLLAEQSIEVSGVMRDPARTTTEKTRIVAEHQQVQIARHHEDDGRSSDNRRRSEPDVFP